MPKILLLSVLFCFSALLVRGQEHFTVKGDSLKRDPPRSDTVKYVNLGKIAARKAAIRSAMIPGWGQIGNGLTVYRGIKVAAIYTGGVLLGLSFVQNTQNYHKFLKEVQYREEHDGLGDPEGGFPQSYPTSGLITAKD
ncbi:MAG TPA: DUF5683 domain-containing protein, partial [Pedobacter sp.]